MMNPEDFKKFCKASNPRKTLDLENLEDQKYYIDVTSVRGETLISEMARVISVLSPEDRTCQLFTGHVGCGKTTELLRLKKILEDELFHVIYFEATDDVDIFDVDVSDLLLSIVSRIIQSLDAEGINLRPNYFLNLYKDIADFLSSEVEFQDTELSLGRLKIGAKLKASPHQRELFRTHVEPYTQNLIEAINEKLLKPAISELKLKNKKGIVIIIDNLDRMKNTIRFNDHFQAEYLFIDRGEQLISLQCHIVYTLPLELTFANNLSTLINRFGVTPKILPMIPVKDRYGNDNIEAITKVKQIVLARAYPNLNEEDRLDKVTDIFKTEESLNCLCLISGGHVRNLMVLLYGCLQKDNPPISNNILEKVILDLKDILVQTITPDEWSLIEKVKDSNKVNGELEHKLLLSSLFVYEYQDVSGAWFGINPIIIH